ncbi:MAG: GIY-YIG nuclease family protein [Aggregatilineales bacterium]
MPKPIDEMTLDELREYARELEKRLEKYEAPDFVYFLHDAMAQVIKVGHSRNVNERLRVLQRQSKRTLTLLGVMPGDKYVKRTIQQQFKTLLTADAEWYRADETLMAYINEHAVPLEGEG